MSSYPTLDGTQLARCACFEGACDDAAAGGCLVLGQVPSSVQKSEASHARHGEGVGLQPGILGGSSVGLEPEQVLISSNETQPRTGSLLDSYLKQLLLSAT